jgi:diguanylate cyclase (GGDEF)-like protein
LRARRPVLHDQAKEGEAAQPGDRGGSRDCGVIEARQEFDSTELELHAYERLAGLFAALLSEQTLESLLATLADALESLVPCSGLVLFELNEADRTMVPLVSRGSDLGAEVLKAAMVAHGSVNGSLTLFREDNERSFSDAEIRFVRRLADAAALALDSAKTRARLAQLAQTDDLTATLNRRGFFEAAERELARATRDGSDTALLVVDVDELKRVNDRFGHSMGDALLVSIAQTIMTRTRRGDIIGRLGGDEFAVVLPGAGIDAAENLAHELESLFHKSVIETDSGPLVPAASVGVAASEGRRTGVVRLLARADVDMYRRKRKRKGQ